MTTLDRDLASEDVVSDRELDPYAGLLARLNHQSVVKHFDAYADVDWDSPELAIDASDPRWELRDDDTLGSTAWYQGLPQPTRARLGLDLVASKMKTGLEFESVLKRGLLEYAATLPNGSPEFRYAYHEVIEEAQHSLMFQEFVNRSGFDAKGLNRFERAASRFIVSLGRRFPPLFFVFVLGGADPIDHVQRKELGLLRRAQLAVGAPLVLAVMAQLMLRPSPQIVRRYHMPTEVVAEAFTRNPTHHAEALASMHKLRRLWIELGLAGSPYRSLWRLLRIWPDDTAGPGGRRGDTDTDTAA